VVLVDENASYTRSLTYIIFSMYNIIMSFYLYYISLTFFYWFNFIAF